MRRRRVAIAAGLLLPAGLVAEVPVTGTLDQRLRALEESQRGGRSQVELVAELQSLRAELRQLRGMVEEQRNAVTQLERRQRDLYLDLDDRLAGLERLRESPAPRAGAANAAPDAPSSPGVGSGAGDSASPATAAERTAYEQGFDLVKQRRYEAAINALREFLIAYPGGGYADNAQYWIAECFYVTQRNEEALQEFRKVLDSYPDSTKGADALLKIGYIQAATGQTELARASLEQVTTDWPGTAAAQLAQRRLGNLSAAAP